MANVEEIINKHCYRCHSCDITCYAEAPREGYWFRTSEGYRDEDGDTFYEGETKVLIGTKCFACHNDESPCILEDNDNFTIVECHGFRCGSCGVERFFDNDYCHVHDYSDRDNAKRDATNCCSVATDKPRIDNSGDLTALATKKEKIEKVTVIEF
jgi:hypothetical protein